MSNETMNSGRQPDSLWTSLRYHNHVIEAVCLVDSPNAADVALKLRRRFGWKVVYDHGRAPSLNGSVAEPSDFDDVVDLVFAGTANVGSAPGPVGRVSSRQYTVEDFGGADFSTAYRAIEGLYPKVSIILLMYNGLDYNRQCLGSIFDKTAYPNFEVIVVDNNSTDGTRDFLAEVTRAHPNVKVILNDRNEGYTHGNNQGAEVSTGDYLVFLNNDTIVTRSWLSRLVFYLGDPKVGLVGPTSSWPGNESGIETSYRTLTELHAFADDYTRVHEGHTYDAGRMVFFSAVTRRDVFEAIGPLDERYSRGVSFEDDDYTMRVRQKGYRIIYAEDAFVHHWGVGTNSRRDMKAHWQLLELNRRQFEEKWGIKWDPSRGVRARRG